MAKEKNIINGKLEYNIKQEEWDMAIGLQMVDNLKPSKYLETLIKENVEDKITINELLDKLKSYYMELEKNNEVDHEELECDLVSTRIVRLLHESRFELTVDYLKYVHEYLFKDVYGFAGKFRRVNIAKNEVILNNESVLYGDFNTINKALEYDISIEKSKDYTNMGIDDVINNITDFSSNIWQTHPFREGNTRTSAIFICKYLIYMGYSININVFKDESIYFRNALVKSNYFNKDLNIKEDNSYLIKFYEKLLLGK